MAEPLKLMYSNTKLSELAAVIKTYHKKFSSKDFLFHFTTSEWNEAELKARVRLITKALRHTLPHQYEKAIEILVPVSAHFSWGFFGVFFPDYVEQYGRNDWQISMNALSEFTKSSTSEFAIRPFILEDQKRTMKQMLLWSKDRNFHIRRFSSEGCRPRLPWGMRLHEFVASPLSIIPILENLKDDPELYVRKSVANNLNDISKDHPNLVLDIAESWIGQSERTDWIIRHALRSLLKDGNKRALKLFGHHDSKGLEVLKLKLASSKIFIGEKLDFSFIVKNSTKKNLDSRIEYAIDYKKMGGTFSRKIFQISKVVLAPGEHIYNRHQQFLNLTTRKHHEGIHQIYVLINGEILASAEFFLKS